MKKTKLKLAFLGGGINSAIGKTHYISIKIDTRYELVAGYFSPEKQINQQSAYEYDIAQDKVYNSLTELIRNEKDNIDAICILTPTNNHKDEVIECLNNGIPVICEKALAKSCQEGEEIKKNLLKNNGFLAVTYNYSGYPMLRELKNMIANGKLGKLNQIHIEIPQETYLKVDETNSPSIPQAWRLKDYKIPTLSLDLGSHAHNLVSFLIEEKPLEVVALQNNFGLFNNLIDNSIAIANYTNNIVANIWYSKTALGHTNGLKIRIYGELGSAQWYQLEPENLYFYDNKGGKYIIDRANISVSITNQKRYNRFKAGHPSGFIEAFANYYGDIADSLLKKNDNNPYIFGIENALEGLKMMEAITLSSQQKKWIEIK